MLPWDFDGIYPLVMTNIAMALWKMAIEIMRFPIKNCDVLYNIFYSYVSLPEGTLCPAQKCRDVIM